MILIFSLTDDINRVLEQQWTDFNRSSYNTRNHLSRCRRILQGTWRGQLPPGWSVEGKWYVRLSNGGYIHLSVLKWKHCCDSRLSVVERWWVMKNSCSVGEIRFCNMWLAGWLSGLYGFMYHNMLVRSEENFQEWVLSFCNMGSVD